MDTLVVYYSKTGHAKKVAGLAIEKLGCAQTELVYDKDAKSISGGADPAGYDKVILVCPVWAFELADPMKLYLQQYGKSIKSYSLIVTCGGLGLRTCVWNCVKAIGKQPLKSMKIRDGALKADKIDLSAVL